jgi:hypothetical protein
MEEFCLKKIKDSDLNYAARYHSNRMIEIILCALFQGYGEDCRPLFKCPIINLGTYAELMDILRSERQR